MNPDKEDHRALALWAADCAERVLPYFEEQHPEDDRPRKAIEAGRAWVRGDIKVGEARTTAFDAHAAAREADEGSARQRPAQPATPQRPPTSPLTRRTPPTTPSRPSPSPLPMLLPPRMNATGSTRVSRNTSELDNMF